MGHYLMYRIGNPYLSLLIAMVSNCLSQQTCTLLWSVFAPTRSERKIVSLMISIHKNAERAIVWLGQEADELAVANDLAVEWVDHILSQSTPNPEVCDGRQSEQRNASTTADMTDGKLTNFFRPRPLSHGMERHTDLVRVVMVFEESGHYSPVVVSSDNVLNKRQRILRSFLPANSQSFSRATL